MENWTLRKARQGDVVEIIQCIDRAYARYVSQISDLPAVSDGIEDDIANNIVWVAAANNRIVGALVLIDNEDHVVLANVAVDPCATGRGLGRALIELAESETAKLCKYRIRLSTHIDMPENIRLYEHLGWREIGQSGRAVLMEKQLEKG